MGIERFHEVFKICKLKFLTRLRFHTFFIRVENHDLSIADNAYARKLVEKTPFLCYVLPMTITQTVEIPESRRLIIDVPAEVPSGKTILTFTPASEKDENVYTTLSNERAITMTSDIIEKYRPALVELSK